jgi:hypothetical protein
MRSGKLSWAQPEAVATLRKEMEFGGNPGVLERLVVHERSLYVRDLVVLGLNKKGRRNAIVRLCCRAQLAVGPS